MPTDQTKLWWPFPIPPIERRTEEIKAKVAFLEEAARLGLCGYADQSDCGAVAPNGRECAIVWRGKQRSELLLIDFGAVIENRLFADLSEGVAFRNAAGEAFAWLLQVPQPTGTATTGVKLLRS